MGITLVALLLFVAMVACWALLPGSVVATEAAQESEKVAPVGATVQMG